MVQPTQWVGVASLFREATLISIFCEGRIWMAEMTKQEKNLLKNKLEYLKLAYRISIYRLSGEEAPEELLRKARTTRIAADFSKEELDNVLKC